MKTDHGALAFVGAGALGQAFAAFLAASGQPVSILATPARAAQLRADGHIRIYGVQELTIPIAAAPAPSGTVGIATDAAQLPAVDGLIFTTKAHQLPEAIATVRRARADAQIGWVAGAQNGLAKDTMLVDAFGPERCVGMVTILSGQRDEDGRVNVRSTGMTYLGELAGGSSARVDTAAALLSQASLPSIATADIQSVLWSKACHAAGIFGASAPARASIPGLMASPDLVRVYLALMRESAAIAAAYGIALGDYAGFPVRSYRDQPDAETLALFATAAASMRSAGGSAPYSSMAHDMLYGRALEVDEIFGDLVARAEQAGVSVPRLVLIRDLLRGMDPGRHASLT